MDSMVNIAETGLKELLPNSKPSAGGSTSSEVKKRHQQFGFNEILEKKKNPAIKLLCHFGGPIPITLETTSLIVKVIAAAIAVYGRFVALIGWKLAGFVWGHARLAFVLTDFVKYYFVKIIIPGQPGMLINRINKINRRNLDAQF